MSIRSFADGPPPVDRPLRRRSTRDRPAKAPLSEEVIVDAALAILQSDGLEAVTMRRVAAALDTGAASLYVYVAGSDGLQAAMLDRVIAGVELQSPHRSRWRSQLHSLLSRMHDALVAHPGIAAITLADPPTTEAALLLNENLLGILLAGGLDPQSAAWACDTFILLVTASAREEDERGAHHGKRHVDAEKLHELLAGLPQDRFPLLVAHASQMVAGETDERFRYAIDVVIDGMLAQGDPPKIRGAKRKSKSDT